MSHEESIIDEIHRHRREYSAKFQGDLQAMLADIRAGEKELKTQGWNVISLPPRRIPLTPAPIDPPETPSTPDTQATS